MMSVLLVETPNYVLLERTQRIGPELLALDSGQDCIAVYGFSDKQPYDAFCENSELALTPYPLVKGYLRNRLEVAEDTILLIAIDAAGPDEPILNAATMQLVLEAHETQSSQVSVSYRLTKDEQTPAYCVEEYGSVVPMRLHR
jgi:hypothetical protein